MSHVHVSSINSPSFPPRRTQVGTLLRSLLFIDFTQLSFVPGMRTSTVIMVDWILFGIGNANTTSFQLAALVVGLSDPNGSFTLRVRHMGYSWLSVVGVGTFLPSLVFGSTVGTLLTAVVVAFVAAYSPRLGSPALALLLKLSTALFAIQGAIYRNGVNAIGMNAVYRAFWGGFFSLLAALLPKVLGTRDAIRSDLFKLWYGFGKSLRHWKASWGTRRHTIYLPVPNVTLSMAKTTDRMQQPDVYGVSDMTTKLPASEQMAHEWLTEIVQHVDAVRAAILCLSNGYRLERARAREQGTSLCGEEDNEEEPTLDRSVHISLRSFSQGDQVLINRLFLSLSKLFEHVGHAFQFPWFVRYLPGGRKRTARRRQAFHDAVQEFQQMCRDVKRRGGGGLEQAESQTDTMLQWLPGLVQFLQTEVDASVKLAVEAEEWPPYSSPWTLSQRLSTALVPSKLPQLQPDPDGVIFIYTLRYALAFPVATLPELLLLDEQHSAHWFPMTVALIMGQNQAATYEKVMHRTIGTLCGIALGSALSPLFDYPGALIFLLGLCPPLPL